MKLMQEKQKNNPILEQLKSCRTVFSYRAIQEIAIHNMIDAVTLMIINEFLEDGISISIVDDRIIRNKTLNFFLTIQNDLKNEYTKRNASNNR